MIEETPMIEDVANQAFDQDLVTEEMVLSGEWQMPPEAEEELSNGGDA